MFALLASSFAKINGRERWTTALSHPQNPIELRLNYDPVFSDACIVSSDLAKLLHLPIPANGKNGLYICEPEMEIEIRDIQMKASVQVGTFGVDFDADGLFVYLPPKVHIKLQFYIVLM